VVVIEQHLLQSGRLKLPFVTRAVYEGMHVVMRWHVEREVFEIARTEVARPVWAAESRLRKLEGEIDRWEGLFGETAVIVEYKESGCLGGRWDFLFVRQFMAGAEDAAAGGVKKAAFVDDRLEANHISWSWNVESQRGTGKIGHPDFHLTELAAA
jgi:hypothetical protein